MKGSRFWSAELSFSGDCSPRLSLEFGPVFGQQIKEAHGETEVFPVWGRVLESSKRFKAKIARGAREKPLKKALNAEEIMKKW